MMNNYNDLDDNVKDSFFDVVFHLFFHKRLSTSRVENLMNHLDYYINRDVVGRRFTDKRNKDKRVKWIGFIEDTPSNGNKHLHLIIKVGDTDTLGKVRKSITRRFREVFDGGELGVIQTSNKDIVDEYRRFRSYLRNNRKWNESFSDIDIFHQWKYYTKSRGNIVISRGW